MKKRKKGKKVSNKEAESGEGASPEQRGTQTDKEKRRMYFDRLREVKCRGLNVRGNTEKGGGRKRRGKVRVMQADAVCDCLCVSSAVRDVNHRVDRSEKTLETACWDVLLFWASA